MDMELTSQSKRLVMAKDLNGAQALFGGTIVSWMDEQAYIHAKLSLGGANVVTKAIGRVEFESGAKLGDVVEMRSEATAVGRTSLTLRVQAFNLSTGKSIAGASEVVMVNVDQDGKAAPHGIVLNFPQERQLVTYRRSGDRASASAE